LSTKEEQERFSAEQKRIDAFQAPLKQQLTTLEAPYRERLIAEKKSRLADYIQVALRTPPEQRTEGQRLNALQVEKTLSIEPKDLLAALSAPDLARHKEITQQISDLDAKRPAPLPAAMSITEPGREAPKSDFPHRGSAG